MAAALITTDPPSEEMLAAALQSDMNFERLNAADKDAYMDGQIEEHFFAQKHTGENAPSEESWERLRMREALKQKLTISRNLLNKMNEDIYQAYHNNSSPDKLNGLVQKHEDLLKRFVEYQMEKEHLDKVIYKEICARKSCQRTRPSSPTSYKITKRNVKDKMKDLLAEMQAELEVGTNLDNVYALDRYEKDVPTPEIYAKLQKREIFKKRRYATDDKIEQIFKDMEDARVAGNELELELLKEENETMREQKKHYVTMIRGVDIELITDFNAYSGAITREIIREVKEDLPVSVKDLKAFSNYKFDNEDNPELKRTRKKLMYYCQCCEKKDRGYTYVYEE